MQAAAVLCDIELMARLGSGEAECMEPLLARHRNPLIHFLSRIVQNRAVAEDLAQEVFLSVYRARGRYQPSAQFTAWLYRIARNKANNWLRDNRHHRNALGLEQVVVMRPAPGATPEQDLLRREAQSRVRAAVQALDERQRVAVLLHKYSELEYAEIAGVLGCSVSAVKALLNRAYTNLRRSLAA